MIAFQAEYPAVDPDFDDFAALCVQDDDPEFQQMLADLEELFS